MGRVSPQNLEARGSMMWWDRFISPKQRFKDHALHHFAAPQVYLHEAVGPVEIFLSCQLHATPQRRTHCARCTLVNLD